MNKFASSSTARFCSPFLLRHNLLAVLFPVKPSCRFLTSTSRARRCVQYPGSFVLARYALSLSRVQRGIPTVFLNVSFGHGSPTYWRFLRMTIQDFACEIRQFSNSKFE